MIDTMGNWVGQQSEMNIRGDSNPKTLKRSQSRHRRLTRTDDSSETNARPQRIRNKKESPKDEEPIEKESKKKKSQNQSNQRGWYRVDCITGHRITRIKNKDVIELRVQWEGYSEPSWEQFTGFVKDTAHLVERYFIRNQLKPFLMLKKQCKLLKLSKKPNENDEQSMQIDLNSDYDMDRSSN